MLTGGLNAFFLFWINIVGVDDRRLSPLEHPGPVQTAAENPAAVLFLDTVLIVIGSAQGVGVFDDNMHCDKGTNAAGQ